MRLELHSKRGCGCCEGTGIFSRYIDGKFLRALCECVHTKPKKGKDDES